MKKYLITVILAAFVVSACNKNEETPVSQKEKTESAINEAVNVGVEVQNSEAIQALMTMPDGAPIENSFPVGSTGKSVIANAVLKQIPFFKRNVFKSPLDSIAGTWEYDESADEWNHTSNEPQNEVVLIWNFQDTTGQTHTARFEFISPEWYNDTLLVRFNAELYVDNQKVAYTHYELTVQSDVSTEVALNGAIVGVVEFSIDANAAAGHNLEEDEFCGTVHISFNDLISGVSFTLDMTANEDRSGSFRFVMNDNGDTWEFYATISVPDSISGTQGVSGYIKHGNVETARIEGTVTDGDLSQVYIVYTDGTRVSVTEYLNGFDWDGL